MNALHPPFPGDVEPQAGEWPEADAEQMALFPDIAEKRSALPPAAVAAQAGPSAPDAPPHGLPAGADPAAVSGFSDLPAPDTTFSERLVRSAFALGVPTAVLVAPFRRPLKPRIKATVECPPIGDRVAGMALRAGHFLIGGTKVPIIEADFAAGSGLAPAHEAVLHGFAWLRDLAASAPAPQCAATAERVLRAWLAANPEPEGTPRAGAWSVESAARRLLAWLVHAPLILGSGDKAYRAAVLEAIGETARWLDRRAGKAADHQSEALAYAALTAAGLLLPEGKPRRLYGEDGLVRALSAMAGEDGGVLSRSPLAQAEAIGMLVELAACYRATRREPPPAIPAMLQLLVPPLVSVTRADGSLGNWQGSGAIPAERVEALVRASGVRPRPLRAHPAEARQWGYQRLAAGEAVLVADAAPPPLARNARSGCASTLAFEFSHGEHALVVNCGGAALAGGQVPMRIEQGLRATAAHSTLVLGDANSTAVLINGKLGKGVAAVEVDRGPVTIESGGPGAGSTATRLDLGHDGYAARFGLTHRRLLTLADDGTVLTGEDRLEPAGRRGGKGKVGYAIRFHLGPFVDLRLAGDGHAADLVLPDGGYWRFTANGATIGTEESLFVDGDGRPHPVQQLVLEGLASRGGDAFAWVLRKMG